MFYILLIVLFLCLNKNELLILIIKYIKYNNLLNVITESYLMQQGPYIETENICLISNQMFKMLSITI